MQKTYTTKRLILRVLDEAFADDVLDYYQRNRTLLEQWEPLRSEDFYSQAYQKQQLSDDLIRIKDGQLLRLWIFREGSDSIIGSVAFNNIIRGAFLSCRLGYKLDMDELNQGYMTEAVEKGIEIMFTDYRLHRIEANIMPHNVASRRVVEKLGFKDEGLAYKYLRIDGKWEDHIHMVLLNEDLD